MCQPTGFSPVQLPLDVSLILQRPPGLQATGIFLRGLLDSYKVKPVFFAREEYKSAAAVFTHKGYTSAHREQAASLIGDIADQVRPAGGCRAQQEVYYLVVAIHPISYRATGGWRRSGPGAAGWRLVALEMNLRLAGGWLHSK